MARPWRERATFSAPGMAAASWGYVRARAANANLERLADGARLLRLKERTGEFWPARARTAPDIAAWLEAARALLERQAEHRAFLESLAAEGYVICLVAWLHGDGECHRARRSPAARAGYGKKENRAHSQLVKPFAHVISFQPRDR